MLPFEYTCYIYLFCSFEMLIIVGSVFTKYNYMYMWFCFLSQVVNLMSVDLLRQQPRWKEALVSLREMMTSLIQQVQSFVS